MVNNKEQIDSCYFLKTIKHAIENIISKQHDDEAAHGDENKLHQEVLRHIQDGSCYNPSICAGEALKTLEIGFERWGA